MFLVISTTYDPKAAQVYPSSIAAVPTEWRHSAGINRGAVEVRIAGLPAGGALQGAILPGTASLQAAGGTASIRYDPARASDALAIVVLHGGDHGGEWHGAGIAVVEPRCAASPHGIPCGARYADPVHTDPGSVWYGPHPFEPGDLRLFIVKHHGQRWLATSTSGGGNYAAGVWVLRPGDPTLTIKVSGYRGRSGWTVLTVETNGRIWRRTLDAYLGLQASEQALV